MATNKRRKVALRGSTMDMMQDFLTKCRGVGLRLTPQRVAVYKALAESKEHPSADMLYRKVKQTMPSISLDTVNRTLLTFVEIDAALLVEGSGDVRRFDGDMHGHQHFKCIKCRIPKAIGERCKVLRKTVYFEGICDLCIEPN